MKFILTDSIPHTGQKNTAYLVWDNWDDWFKYATTYHIVIFDADGERHEPGSLKIGQQGLQQASAGVKASRMSTLSAEAVQLAERTPNVPVEFEALPNTFFSLGQNQHYYETISSISNGESIYKSLRDCAFDLTIYESNKLQDVMQESLLRNVHEYTIMQNLHPLATGKAIPTSYNFAYQLPNSDAKLEVKVIPKSYPPTNIHIIIGRNGVGKTRCLQNLFKAASFGEAHHATKPFGSVSHATDGISSPFSQVVVLAFSSFDQLPPPDKDHVNIPLFIFGNKTYFEYKPAGQFGFFGLPGTPGPLSTPISTSGYGEPALKEEPPHTEEELWARRLFNRIRSCLYGPKKKRLYRALLTLENDPLFYDINAKSLLDSSDDKELWERLEPLYKKLSSGHSIVLQIMTHLVDTVDERSLVLLDEPEEHLHPPLLSAFTRALSDLLINRNAIALVATHSPIMLQEVPRSCVYRLGRSGTIVSLTRPGIETFGENIGTLTSEIFKLEVKTTGFIQMLKDAVTDNPGMGYAQIAKSVFNDQLGAEAKSILMTLVEDGNALD